MNARALGSAAFVFTALFALEAYAAPPVQGAAGKRFRFHGDTEFLGFSHYDPDGAPEGISSAGFGVARPNTLDTGFIQRTPTYGLGFGYIFAKERAIVGGKLSFVVNGTFDEDPDDDDVDVSRSTVGGYIVPYFQWMFMPGNWVRPYVEARLGFGGGATTTRAEGGPVDVEVTNHTISPVVGIGGGAHFWLVDAFSIDLGLNFDYFAPHSRSSGDVPDEAEEWDKDGDLVTLGVLLGFSVWF